MTEMNHRNKRWPGYSADAHPEIFNTIPPQPQQLKPGQLSEEQIKKFFDDGYIVLDSFFKPEELEPVKKAVDERVDELAKKLYAGGKIKSLYEEFGFDRRLAMIERDFPGANIILHKISKLPQEIQSIWSNERLLNIAEQILGTSDIAANPVWNLRTKTPNNEATTVPWHQDAAYLDNRSYKVFHLTGWIPLMNATEETGCMRMLRHGHKTGRVATHTCCYGDTWYVMLSEDEMRETLECDLERDIVTVPVNFGSILLFNNLLPHCSLNNKSDKIRWSVDLRWQRADDCAGFYDLKDSVRLRSSTDPNFKPDWEKFCQFSRHETLDCERDEFDTIINGPWLLKWEMTHTNRHTEAMKRGDITSWERAIYG